MITSSLSSYLAAASASRAAYSTPADGSWTEHGPTTTRSRASSPPQTARSGGRPPAAPRGAPPPGGRVVARAWADNHQEPVVQPVEDVPQLGSTALDNAGVP